MRKIIEIPAARRERKVERIGPYCRVSSKSDDQLHSYAAQIDYYTQKVNAHPGWELADIYADEALTGTRMDKRDDLDRLISDCRKGKIDRVLVKSISRLARNTADSLTILRDLKLLGVSVEIEKEGIDTADLSSEMLLMLWSNHAQAESTSISQNVRWSYQKRMRSGEFITCKAPYGYRLADGKTLVIDEPKAGTVRWMFESYLSGMGMEPIAAALNAKGVPSPPGSARWNHTAVWYILQNEKYTGDTLAQKTYSTDAFPFERRDNHGERDQYYIANTHPAILTREVFAKAQALLASRRPAPTERTPHPLSKRLVCGACGAVFKRRQSKSSYAVWGCGRHDQSKDACAMPRVAEAAIHDAFIRMANKLWAHRDAVLEPALAQLEDLRKAASAENGQLVAVRARLAVLAEQAHKLAALRAEGLLDDETCQRKSNSIAQKRAELRREQHLLMKDDSFEENIAGLRELIGILQNIGKPLVAFDADVFAELVEKITVHSAEQICFRLPGGIELMETVRMVG